MEIFINNAILHVLNNDGGESVFSDQELDIDSDICCEYISKHIKKLINNTSAREATFNPDSKCLAIINQYIGGDLYFKDASHKICALLSDAMQKSQSIPSADVLVVQFEIKNDAYLAIFKLNYKECFMHQVASGEAGSDNQIVKYQTVLPFDGGKVDEACLIPYDPMVVRLLEKPYIIDGESKFYFSELFLDCSPELSKKEVVSAINDIAEEITQQYFEGDVSAMARVKMALIEEAEEEEGYVSFSNVASKVFGDNEEARTDFVSLAKEAGLKSDVNLGEKFVKQQFGSHKFKASNGIELKFPSELTDDSETIEFVNNDDGSVTVVLKNLWIGDTNSHSR